MNKKLLILFLVLLAGCSNGQEQEKSEVVSETSVSKVSELGSEEEANKETNTETNTETPESTSKFYGDLKVDGTNLTDKDGEVVQLKGLSTHGINWFPDYVNKQLFTEINQSTDINTIRIAMYTEDYNGYLNTDQASQEQLLKLIDDAVNFAVELDMYVIIDWHILNDNNPLQHQQEAIEFFTLMSEKYGDIDNVIFEICNEPNGDTTWADIEEYANAVIPAIRANSDNVIIVGTPTWSQDVDQVQKLDFDNVVYTLHFYAATHKEDLRIKAQTAIDNGIPLFVSEFGITEASGNGSVDTAEADEWLEFLDENKISYAMWNLSNKDESSALIKSEVSKTNGFTKDDLTESGKWYLSHVVTNNQNETKSEPDVNEENSTDEKSNDAKEVNVDKTVETWDNGGKYTFDVTNNTESNLSDYTLKITFDKDVTVTDNWNGSATSSGSVVTIVPEEYNSSIEANSKTTDIGIIIECDGIASINSVEIV